MVIVQICVGSSCHLKGAPEIVALFEKSVKEQKLDDDLREVSARVNATAWALPLL